MVTPVTSVAHFIPSENIYNLLGLDSDLDIYTTDPVANIGSGAGYDLLYEKGNQLTILAYSLQNITNDLNSSMENFSILASTLFCCAVKELAEQSKISMIKILID